MYYSHLKLAFSNGLAVSEMDIYAAVLFSPVAIFCLFHFLLLKVVIHQLAVRERNRAQVIGKGVLAEVVWLVPTLIVLFIISGYIMSFIDEETGSDNPPLALMVIGASSVCYGLVGCGLFRWVASPDNEGLGIWKNEGWRNH